MLARIRPMAVGESMVVDGSRGVSPAQVLLALVILAVVALVVIIALRRVAL
jgi:hypothetical protein